MDYFFNLDFISELIAKLDSGVISFIEQDYLQKIISASIAIQYYNNSLYKPFEILIEKYYESLLKFNNNKNLTPKQKADHFLREVEIKKFYTKFNINSTTFMTKAENHFEQLNTLAQFWGKSLKRNRTDIVEFLAILMEELYGIPDSLIQVVIAFLQMDWKPCLAPLGAISQRFFLFQELVEYFFGNGKEHFFEYHILHKADRLFSVTSPEFKNYIFLPKKDDFDIFEAALIIHEFQHILECSHSLKNSLYLNEKKALNAERIFFNFVGTGKRGRFFWLESNLLYPILLLKWELDIFLSDSYNINNFYEICHQHTLEPLELSSLFEWRAPFQMSVYCAASMELEKNWKSFVK